MMKKLRWILLIALVSVIVFVDIYIYSDRYVWNYFSAVGVRSGMTIEQLERRFGEPNELYFRGSIVEARYDAINFIFWVDIRSDTVRGLDGIEIIGPEIRLGRRHIGVGSTREEILRAYENRRDTIVGTVFYERRRDTITGDFYYTDIRVFRVRDGDAWLHFYLDESDMVERITIWLHSPI